ncbi:hypothetical protein [Desmospora profundinema]|uniref:Uncharacterized protein n=1 Tax=Desmospora profundinema TaxID=1571184 RepID=A0ABU1INW4_9BACL|nr:hypothetical protein [Desmospora profundinema]MDR6226481.1 hypothetical protein [Desmospora profundinema]
MRPPREGSPTKTPSPQPAVSSRIKKTSIRDASLDRIWPPLDTEVLAWKELEQDEFYPQLSPVQIPHLVTEAIRFGREAARPYHYEGSIDPWINKVIRSKVKILLIRTGTEKATSSIRAQYRRKPPVIEIHRSSLDQLDRFFQDSGLHVPQDDLIALHLFHEWFHHLESTQLGRADDALPKAVKKQWGPFHFKSRITRLREIAAHAFTQEVMALPWSPLWLDHLMLMSGKNWSRNRIRATFHQWKAVWEEWQNPVQSEESSQKEEEKKPLK